MIINSIDHTQKSGGKMVDQTDISRTEMSGTVQPAVPEKRPLTLKEMMKITLKATQNFRNVIEQETQALNSFDYRRAGTLHDEKKNAASAYADAIEMISKQGDLLKSIPDAAKNIFQKEREAFSNAIQANKLALEKAAILSKRLSDRIIGIAKNHMAENSINYSPYGTAGGQQRKPVYLSFNETL